MNREKQMLIKELQAKGKSYEWSEWAINKIDLPHYLKKYFISELAKLIITYQNKLDLLN